MKYIRIILSSFLVVVGLILFVNFASGFFFKSSLFNAYIVQSGSMEPSIKTGSLVISLPSKNYSQNDVITYKDGKKLVTHRIEVKLFPEGVYSDPIYMTSGDANKSLDRIKLSQGQVVGKVLFSVPYLGYAADFAKTPQGFILFVVIPATIIVYEELKFLFISIISRIREKIKKNSVSNNTSIGINSKLIAFIPIFGAIIVFVGLTNSFFADGELSSQNVFQAGAFATPTPTPTPTPAGIADHLVISEIQINGANANEDFVEIYNPTNVLIDLTGYKIRVRNSAGTEDSLVLIPSGKSILAHGFFLWSNNQGTFETDIGADVSNGNNISPNNSIALMEPDNDILDQVAWGNSTNPFIESTASSLDFTSEGSIERKALSTSTQASMEGGSDASKGNGFDLGDNSTDFILRLVSQPQNSSSGTEMP